MPSHNMEKKPQSTNNMKDGISTVRSWKSRTQDFIQGQSLSAHVLSNIVGGLYIKSSEVQNSMA